MQQFGVTFSMRIEILRSLGKRSSDARLKALARKIDVVRKHRNILAHGNWTTIIVGGGFVIEHVKNGKLEREEFDAAKRKRWQSHAEGVLALLFETYATINPIYFAELEEEVSR